MVEVERPTTTTEAGTTSSTIAADGRYWRLTEPLDPTTTLPPYACASYVWGLERAHNPIHPSIAMSDRTMATFAAVARYGGTHAIWIDAFCVPTEPRAKRATLESMGFIYARAAAVVAVVASESLAAVREMEAFVEHVSCKHPGEVSIRPLETLDEDEWIRSVWTYQEVVNAAGTLLFVSTTEARAAPITGQEMLHAVGGYTTAHGNSSDEPFYWMTIRYRHVLDFENILVDWFTSAYTERSAYRIMSGLNFRTAIAPTNHFYSMVGVLTDKPCDRPTNPTVEGLAQRFMELCEQKGDYSFIFTSRPRDTRPGLRWRPAPGVLKTILWWHSGGEGQPGTRVDEGVLLKNVAVFQPITSKDGQGAFEQNALSVIRGWMRDPPEDTDLPTRVHRALTEAMEFTGVGGWLVTEEGIFYPQDRLPEGNVTICVSRSVRWVFGAPGIAVVDSVEEGLVYSPGIFVGEVIDVPSSVVSEFLLR